MKRKHPDNNPGVYNNLPDTPVATTRIDNAINNLEILADASLLNAFKYNTAE